MLPFSSVHWFLFFTALPVCCKDASRPTHNMSLQDELTETTVEGKLRQLVSVITNVPFEEIGCDFDLSSPPNVDQEYFLEMLAGALTYHFGIEADAETIRPFETLGELTSFIESR